MDAAEVLEPDQGDEVVKPYGGTLHQGYIAAEDRENWTQIIPALARVDLAEDEFQDVLMLGSGAYSPLAGFMSQAQWEATAQDGALPSGLAWGLPVTLAITPEQSRRLPVDEDIALYYNGEPIALMRVDDVYPWTLATARLGYEGDVPLSVFERVQQGKNLHVAGRVTLLTARSQSYLQHHFLWPRETRSLFAQRGWGRVAAMHVKNPWQRTHEYFLKCALEAADGLLLNATINDYSEADGVSPAALTLASRLLLTDFFPNQQVVINPVPRGIFAPGPRAALQHAIISQNYGCDNLYLVPQPGQALTDLQRASEEMFARAARRGLAVRPIYLADAFYCERCGGVATHKSCPHGANDRIVVSQAEIDDKLKRGEQLPLMVTRPEIARALARAVAEAAPVEKPDNGRHLYLHASEVSDTLRQSLIGHKPCVLWMTGLSGSGKSTIAHRLERALMLSDHRATVLDGDTLRHGLNRDLGFSDEARRENQRRAGEVAKIMMDAGMIVIASFIAPFRAERAMVRERFKENFFEVFVDASLEVCEARDPKGLYRRARSGQVRHFTGISSPYEPPEKPDLRLDTAKLTVDECVEQLINFLANAGILRANTPRRTVSNLRLAAAPKLRLQ